MKNKNEGKKNKRTLGDFNCIMDKLKRDGRNKILFKCHFNYAPSKFIVNMDGRVYGEQRT